MTSTSEEGAGAGGDGATGGRGDPTRTGGGLGVGEGIVLHALSRADWEGGGDPLRPPSLAAEGFVHLSTPAQIAEVCDRYHAATEDLVLLVVDPARLPVPLVWEDSYGAGRAYPHLYAPLPRIAVLLVVPYGPGPDGRHPAPPLTALR